MLDVAQKMRPPRALFCEFPLGRPLGEPGDAAFQHDVLARGLALLDAEAPVIETHPQVIEADETPLACSLPPPATTPTPRPRSTRLAVCGRHTTGPSRRRGFTSVGRAIDADTVPDALATLAAWADGAAWKEHPLPGKNTVRRLPRHTHLLHRGRARARRWPAARRAPGRGLVLRADRGRVDHDGGACGAARAGGAVPVLVLHGAGSPLIRGRRAGNDPAHLRGETP